MFVKPLYVHKYTYYSVALLNIHIQIALPVIASSIKENMKHLQPDVQYGPH